MDDGRLLEVLEGANGTLKNNKAQLEYIKGTLCFEVGRLGDGALHEVALGGVHFEDAEWGGSYLVFWGVLMW